MINLLLKYKSSATADMSAQCWQCSIRKRKATGTPRAEGVRIEAPRGWGLAMAHFDAFWALVLMLV